MNDFPIYTDEDRQTYLAYYFERLARHLLHTQEYSPDEWLSNRSAHCYDIHDYPTAFVEVKGASNTDQLKLFTDQLDAQLEELGFPVDQGLVWIFSYINRGGKNGNGDYDKQRLLKRGSGKSWNELSAFLASHTNNAYVVDIRLLDLLRKAWGIRIYNRDKTHERQTLNLTRTLLKSLAYDARTTLLGLGIPASELPSWLPPKAQRIHPRYISTMLDGNSVQFKLIPLLANSAKKRFLRKMNGTVKKSPPTSSS